VTEIDVEVLPQADGWMCCVTLSDDGGRSEHRVTVSRDDLERYAPGATDPAALVRRSFEFLLDREPRGSILHDFDLPVIERYFRDYPEAIRPGF
jgi:hypothetical protein